MLSTVAILILGPLGGISAAFMNFSIGFFIGGQVLAGILGSTVTLPYGSEGKHGANYMQTMAASVAGMCAMSVLVQAMVWLGLAEPPAWQLVLYFLCIGMFGVGIGMLYTPILVDRMRLAYPSGYAVANILRALTDKNLLKRSISKLGTSMLIGYGVGLVSLTVATLSKIGVSASTVGAGMIVGARIAIPALVVALIGVWQTPHLVQLGWLGPKDHYRKIGFVISLGTILGAAILDISLILIEAGLCAAILLIATSEGGDMQQDRSTGWRLGTNRIVQFRYQVIGIAVGAVLAVVLAKLFMSAYPILKADQFAHPDLEGTQKWQSAMTFKFVGALRGITTAQPHVIKALEVGILIGLGIEIVRRLIKKIPGYKNFSSNSVTGKTTDFLLDAVLLPNPYASSFGGFVELNAVLWWTAGGIGASIFEWAQRKAASTNETSTEAGLPADMSTMSLLGGGLIAGDSLAALSLGVYGLIKVLL